MSQCGEVRIKLMTMTSCLNILAQDSSFFIKEEELNKLSTYIAHECPCALNLAIAPLQSVAQHCHYNNLENISQRMDVIITLFIICN